VEAEETGWDGVFVWDHVRWREPVLEVADAWITLAAIAAATRAIRLGPMVTPLARRRPVKVARESATLDRLSRGRLTLGVGLGSDRHGSELTITGEELDDRRRADMLDESLEILTAAWSGESVHHRGPHYTVDGMRFLPRPVQRPAHRGREEVPQVPPRIEPVPDPSRQGITDPCEVLLGASAQPSGGIGNVSSLHVISDPLPHIRFEQDARPGLDAPAVELHESVGLDHSLSPQLMGPRTIMRRDEELAIGKGRSQQPAQLAAMFGIHRHHHVVQDDEVDLAARQVLGQGKVETDAHAVLVAFTVQPCGERRATRSSRSRGRPPRSLSGPRAPMKVI
jgi:hypothetical protein